MWLDSVAAPFRNIHFQAPSPTSTTIETATSKDGVANANTLADGRGAGRTHYIKELNLLAPGTRVCLSGWIERKRLMGGLLFVLLRDHTGTVQCTWSEQDANAVPTPLPHYGMEGFAAASDASLESVVTLIGTVTARPSDMVRSDQVTGAIEVALEAVQVLNHSAPLPIQYLSPPTPAHSSAFITSTSSSSTTSSSDDDLRLRYRFLDLRRQDMQRILRTRAAMTLAARNQLAADGFIEVETPALVKSTPEGAREFLVPARSPGKFYALPQSPQQHKQLLMAAGVDKYFQIARCFRDESGRQDRQPEFTQIDMEMSFVTQDDIMAQIERLVSAVHASARGGQHLSLPFPRMRFLDAMNRYGSDKPDIRYGLEIQDVTKTVRAFARKCEQEAKAGAEGAEGAVTSVSFDPIVQSCMDTDELFLSQDAEARADEADRTQHLRSRDVGAYVKVLVARGFKLRDDVAPQGKGAGSAGGKKKKTNAKDVEAMLKEEARLGGASGLLVVDAGKWKVPSSMRTFLDVNVREAITRELKLQPSDVLYIASGAWEHTCIALGRVRSALIRLHLDKVMEIDDIGVNAFVEQKRGELRREGQASAARAASSAPADIVTADGSVFHWVVDFPLFEVRSTAAGESPNDPTYNEAIVSSTHHPFTAPHPGDVDVLQACMQKMLPAEVTGPLPVTAPAAPAPARGLSRADLDRLGQVRAQHYDLVANGLEVGGGSVRMHRNQEQEDVFRMLNVGKHQFAHLLEALQLGASLFVAFSFLFVVFCAHFSLICVVFYLVNVVLYPCFIFYSLLPFFLVQVARPMVVLQQAWTA